MRLLIRAANGDFAVECGRMIEPCGGFDRVIAIPDGMARPGLINAHDHLRLNHFGRLGRPPYANAYDWARDIQNRDQARIAEGRQLPRRQALLQGAWKNLRSGVTHVAHHDSWETDFERDFPITVVRVPFADSLGMTPGFARPETWPFALHLAEGVDANASAEIGQADTMGLLSEGLLAVHVVGVDAGGMAKLRASGAAIVWCPSSNLFLFGRTAPAALLAESIDVLLGTDSLLTGAGGLLDELRLARRLNLISDDRLEDAVGGVAARRLGLPPPSLDAGAQANLIVLRKPLLEACDADVALVVAGGAIRLLDPRYADTGHRAG